MSKFYCFILINFSIISYFFAFCKEQDYIEDKCGEKKCLRIILYNNGLIEEKCEQQDDYISEPMTITLEDKIIIYQCKNKEGFECKYNPQMKYNNSSICLTKNVTSKENSCCYIIQKEIKNNTIYHQQESCIEINKYEFERYRGINESKYDSINDNNTNISVLICFGKLNKINKFLILFLLIIFNF